MKKWTHTHTLVTLGVVAVAGYLVWNHYNKTTSAAAATTPTAPSTGSSAASFTGGTSYFRHDGKR